MEMTLKEIGAKVKRNLAGLQTAYEKFAESPRYVSSHACYPERIRLSFDREDAIEVVSVQINWEGDFIVSLSCWSGCPDKTRNAIENKTFETAEEALDYALETVNKINEFFNQF